MTLWSRFSACVIVISKLVHWCATMWFIPLCCTGANIAHICHQASQIYYKHTHDFANLGILNGLSWFSSSTSFRFYRHSIKIQNRKAVHSASLWSTYITHNPKNNCTCIGSVAGLPPVHGKQPAWYWWIRPGPLFTKRADAIFQSFWNWTSKSAAALPRCLSNFSVIRSL